MWVGRTGRETGEIKMAYAKEKKAVLKAYPEAYASRAMARWQNEDDDQPKGLWVIGADDSSDEILGDGVTIEEAWLHAHYLLINKIAYKY